MSVKPILFNTEMIRVILEERKTVTRRVIKPRFKGWESGWRINRRIADNAVVGLEYTDEEECGTGRYISPPYQTGEILYVRETCCRCGNPRIGIQMHYEYRADMENPNYTSRGFHAKWTPSIYMPKEAARIWLKVTGVRVERLREIKVKDALKEGVDFTTAEYMRGVDEKGESKFILDKFGEIWDSTVKKEDLDKYGWDANPWVWVIEFERTVKPDGNMEI